jgi:putative effector of murein hydrolase LrgA (UPF0299 family)
MNNSLLAGMVTLFFFQFLGETINILFLLVIPGPIIGMILLLMFLLLRKKSFGSLDTAVVWLLRYLPLLIIPAAAGVITQLDTISKEFWPIVLSLSLGTFLALAISMKVMDILISKQEKNNEH